jgi:hypothetical protein
MGWNGVGKLIEVQGNMDKVQYCDILEDGVQESFEKLEMVDGEQYFQQDNTCLDWLHSDSKTTTFKSLAGLPNTSGNISSVVLSNIQHHPKEYMSCGIEWLKSGMKFHQRYAKT